MDGTPRTHESKSINMHRYNWYNFLCSTFGKKSILLSSDLVNSVGTLQARESCSKNNWSKVADCISVFYYWKFTVIKSSQWHSLVRHPTLSVFAQFPLLFVLKVRNKIQTLLTQDHREMWLQSSTRIYAATTCTCSVNCKPAGLSTISQKQFPWRTSTT